MEQVKEKQNEMTTLKRRALDDLELKLEKHQECVVSKQQELYKEKEWRNKLKSMRFMDMEENKKHIMRVTVIKVGVILNKQQTATEKIKAKIENLDNYIKQSM